MSNTREETEQHIIQVAMKVFTEKGFKGATMRDISTAADVNLAMLNYYFRSKENLFEIIFQKAFTLIYSKFFVILSGDKPILDKIQDMVYEFMDILIQNPALPAFIFGEINHNPDLLANRLKNAENFEKLLDKLQHQIDKEVKEGIIKPFTFMELYLNIDSLCVFPFIVKPLFSRVFNMSDMNYGVMLERRKASIAELIINGLKR